MDDHEPSDASQDRFIAAIVASSEDAIIGKDLNGIVLTWNEGARRLYGYTAQEVVGRSIAILFPDDRRGELIRILQQLRIGQAIDHLETVRRAKAGNVVDVSVTVSPVKDASGRIIGGATIARDITARKRAEVALRTSEQRWRSIVDSAVDGIIVIDRHGRIESFNPGAERLFGYAEAEVVGKNVHVLMPPPYREEHDDYLARYLNTGHAKVIGIGRAVRGLRRDGSTFALHLSVGEFVVNEERKFTGILHDLTARVQLEERLREQAALAHLGEMAAVIAHEVRNPLAGIRGAIQVIGGRIAADSPDATVAGEIVKRIDALNDLIKDLLLFARPPTPKPRPLEIVQLASITAIELGRDPSLAEVRVEVAGEASSIIADPELLRIVFLNLLINSAHAIEGQGVIRVRITAAQGECRIEFRDDGPGIPPEIRDKVFAPFFTTKAKGTGLGLSTVKRLVEAHGGSISIDCPAGGGTIVAVCLPTDARGAS